MKTKQKTPIVLLLALSCAAYGQEPTTKPVKRVIVHDFYLQPGIFMQSNTRAGLADFQKLAPQYAILKTNLSDYNGAGGTGFNADAMLTVLMGIQFRDKERAAYKKNPLLRVGVSFLTGSNLMGNFNKTTSKPYDTLTSSQTGQVVFRDSIIMKSVNMNYRSQQLRLDASFIFRTNPDARWSLFAGVGITAGLSINAVTEISYWSSNTVNNYSSQQYYGSYNAANNKTEQYNNSASFGASAYIPIGVDFRLGRKLEFWKRTHLFYEARTGVNTVTIPELRNYANVSLQQGIGLRVSWN